MTELKSLPKPPAGVDMVTAACLILLEHEYKNHKWDRAKKMMANVDQFKASLQAFKYDPSVHAHSSRSTRGDWNSQELTSVSCLLCIILSWTAFFSLSCLSHNDD